MSLFLILIHLFMLHDFKFLGDECLGQVCILFQIAIVGSILGEEISKPKQGGEAENNMFTF